MRTVLRAATVAATATGLLATSAVVALPVVAAEPTLKPSTLQLSLTNRPYVGGSCTVSLRLTTASGQVGGASVAVQVKVRGEKWKTYKYVTTRKTTSVKVSRTTAKSTKFRARYLGSETVKGDRSSVVTCTPYELRSGVAAPGVKKLQKSLKKLRVRPASTTGRFDFNTLQAVYAYQKSRKLDRTGTVNGALYNKIRTTKRLVPSTWCRSADTICIDISKQAAYLKIKGKRYTIPVSSGGEYYYVDPQSKSRDYARTPRGTFRVYYKKPGLSTGPLGTYYWMSFFTGGYGVHGSDSVPTYAASHGCVRVPRTIEQWVYGNLPVGAQVHVHN